MRRIIIKKNLIILAVSDKNNNYCVAAYDKESNTLIRLVDEGYKNEAHVNWYNCYDTQTNNKIKVLDKVLFSDIYSSPIPQQPENHAIKYGSSKNVQGSCSIEQLETIYQNIGHPKYIFGNCNYKLNEDEFISNTRSLMLCYVNDFQLYIADNDKTKCNFKYKKRHYRNFSVTDPNYKNTKKHFKEAYLLLSTPPPSGLYHNEAFKFCAAIFPKSNAKLFT